MGRPSSTTSISIAFRGAIDGRSLAGWAPAAVGLGPIGIGGGVHADAISGPLLPSHLPFTEARATALWSEDFVISGATGAGFAQAFIVGAVGATIGEGSLGMTLWQAIPNGFSGGWLDPMPVTFGAPYTFSIRGFTGCRTGESGCGDQSAPCSAGSCTTGTF